MSRTDILSHLRSLGEEHGGVIPFEHFMNAALYHPEIGYYSANISDVGSRGDFSTSATLGKELARALASWIIVRDRELLPGRLSLVEIGAGSGDLAADILRNLGWWRRRRTDYVIVETSPVLRERQRRKLRGFGVRWAASVGEALGLHGGHALIFSNEVPDAFPCRVFEKTASGWSELGIILGRDGSLSETLLPPEEKDHGIHQFDHLPEGQRVERHDSYREWLSSWHTRWKGGSMLTIDYGGMGETIYARRPGGTVRAYWKHSLLTGAAVYARFGRQDITADVSFDSLEQWGRNLGWKTRSLGDMAAFLKQWDPASSATPSRFSEPDGAGESFMVLEQGPSSEMLRGERT